MDEQNPYDDIYGDSNKGGKSGLDKATDAGKKAKNAGKKAAKAAKHAAKLGKLFATPVGWVILGIIAAILLIFLIIGAVSFLQTMPGLILGKLLDIVSDAWDWIASEATGSDVEQSIKEEDLIGVAQQVKDMGYDLYTNGFGKPLYEDEEDPSKITGIDEHYDSPLFRYVYADVRTYTKKTSPNIFVTALTRRSKFTF